MTIWRVRLFLIIIVGWVFASVWGVAWAETEPASFQCGGCHESPREILPEAHQPADFRSCYTCHGPLKTAPGLGVKAHQIHFLEKEVTPEACIQCHRVDKENYVLLSLGNQLKISRVDLPMIARKMAAWVQSEQLAYVHNQQGVSCLACHTTLNEDDWDGYSDRCIACHGGYEKLAKKPTRFKVHPHKLHIPNLACASCHQSHAPFKDYCTMCHQHGLHWEINIPK